MTRRLPPGRTRFHGRESERSELLALLRGREVRLVTLQGAPGTGKTRLALEVARELEGSFDVWPCDLSAARSAADAALALADALELELPERSDVKAAAAALTRALGTVGDQLLLLDHLEHLLPDVRPLLEACLDAGPHVVVLATSRERLDVAGERCVALAPLPDDDAVALFLDRARAAGAALGDDALPVVRELVTRLDGVPLALELAAARARVLSPRRLLERLEERLSVLGGTHADLPTLEEAIRLSWDRLSVVEQRALARASVFAGAFSLESAEAVLRDDEEGAARGNAGVLDVLQALVDRSLLASVPARDGEVRFRLLENVRAFAAARARELSLEEEARERHALWLAAESERRLVPSRVSQPAGALAWLQGERDELLAVVRRAPSSDQGRRAAVTCALALHALLRERGPAEVHHEVLERAEALRGELPDEGDDGALSLRVRAASVILRRDQRDWRATLDELADVRARAEACGAGDLAADTERVAGEILFIQGQHDASIARLEAAIARYGIVGAREGAALSKTLLGPALIASGRHDDAERVLLEAVREADASDLARVGARAQYRLGLLAHQRGDLEDATARYEAALERLGARSGDLSLEAGVKHKLAVLHHERGELDAAVALLEEAVALYETVGSSWYAGATLSLVGAVKADLGDLDEAVRLARKAEALLATSGPPASGFAAAWLGAVECRRGERAAAKACFARAHEALDGRGDAFDRALLEILESHLLVLDGAASVDDVLGRAREKGALGATPRYGLRFLERSLFGGAGSSAHRGARGPRSLVVAADARWFAPPAGSRVDVAKKRVLRRLLAALVEKRLDAPGAVLSRAELLEAGWPGERMRPDSALSRLYVSVASLRRLGLEDVLLTAGDGYLLDPELEITLERPATTKA